MTTTEHPVTEARSRFMREYRGPSKHLDDPLEYDPVVADAISRGYLQYSSAPRNERTAAVHLLRERGLKTAEIARRINGVSERQVLRDLEAAVVPMDNYQTPSFDYSDVRQDQLDDVAHVAMGMAVDIRTSPLPAWDKVSAMDADQLRELVMVMACMVPVDMPVSRLLGWVHDHAR